MVLGENEQVGDGEIDTSSDAIAAMFRVYYLSMTSTGGFYGLGRVSNVQLLCKTCVVPPPLVKYHVHEYIQGVLLFELANIYGNTLPDCLHDLPPRLEVKRSP